MRGAKPVKRSRELDPVMNPWVPTVPTKSEVAAVKALFVGNANAAQQGFIINYLMRMTGARDLETRPDERASTFAGGKRFVGLQFVRTSQLTSESVKGLPEG